MKQEAKSCQNCKQEFVIESEDFDFYKKISVPPPTFCPLCRAQRRFNWRNEWMLYKRRSDFSGKDIFAMYAPETSLKVFEKEAWMSDEWDPMDYGRDYDFSRNFFEQFSELFVDVPHKNLDVLNGVNSDYTNNLTDPKNSYLVFNGSHPEDVMYANGINYCRDSVDISHSSKAETCYGGFWLNECTRCIYCSQCDNSFDLWFSKNCVGCSNCFGCMGLRKKTYHIFNEPYSKDEYFKKLESFNLSSYTSLQVMKKKSEKFWDAFPNKYLEGLKNDNVSGSYIDRCRNVKDSLLVRESENLKYCQYVQELPGSKDCYDYSVWGDNNQLVYECHSCGVGTQNIKFSVFVREDVHDLEYCYACTGSSYLFGCVGLRRKQYCIFNRQYDKKGYFDQIEKIKKQMDEIPYTDKRGCVYRYGEFFPADISPFAYNECLSQEYFPLSKEEATSLGYNWRDTTERDYKITVLGDGIPDDIAEVDDNITNEIIECEHQGDCEHPCATAFRIVKDELKFYKKLGLPLPRLCPHCRSFERLKQRLGIHLYEQACQCWGDKDDGGVYSNTGKHFHGSDRCPNTFQTGYSPDQKKIVYCEQCYQAEVV